MTPHSSVIAIPTLGWEKQTRIYTECFGKEKVLRFYAASFFQTSSQTGELASPAMTETIATMRG
jgi:hypothetical protein